MITDVLFNIFYGIVNALLTPVSSIGNIVVNSSMFLPIVNVLKIIFYVLPMPALLPIFYITVSLMTFRIVISLLKTLWGILPIV